MTDFTGIPLAATRFGPPAPRPQPEISPEIRHAAEEFESMFLAEMMKPMFEGLDTDGLGGGGAGEEMFRPMLIEQYGKAISQAGGVGLADSIMQELARMQASQAAQIQPEAPIQVARQVVAEVEAANGADR